jgi:protein TonB
VAQGQLLVPIRPVYPAIALASRTQGTVVVAATISKDGRIENLRVVSGPAMLVNAAVQAISQARYRPYLLNNEPVEVETTINVVFRLGGDS